MILNKEQIEEIKARSKENKEYICTLTSRVQNFLREDIPNLIETVENLMYAQEILTKKINDKNEQLSEAGLKSDYFNERLSILEVEFAKTVKQLHEAKGEIENLTLALKRISSCESNFPGDVVSIAKGEIERLKLKQVKKEIVKDYWDKI